MPRTAPVPNIPAIPGMNPGAWVAGGGAGGGSGSGNGKGGKNGQGANGNNGGDGANGDGRGACSSGQGNGAGCPNHHGARTSPGVGAGDPVEIATGAVATEPVTDARLPGPLPFAFVRCYRSALADTSTGLGFGWSHSLAWRLLVRRREVQIHSADASVMSMPLPAPDGATIGDAGWVLVPTEQGWVLDSNDGFLRTFEATEVAGHFRLASVRDKSGNTILVRHDARGRLVEVVDSVGRTIRVAVDAAGRIGGLSLHGEAGSFAFVQYAYDEQGDLVRVTDADGYTTHYRYQDHRLVRLEHPNQVTFHYRYDDAGRCVETWGTLPEGDGGEGGYLAPSVPALLADHETRARGLNHARLRFGHDGVVEAADSLRVTRLEQDAQGNVTSIVAGGAVFSRTYDGIGMLTSFTDPTGATWQFTRDARGREIAVTDPTGATTHIHRDPNGDIRQVIGPMGETTTVSPRPDGMSWTDPIGATFDLRFDGRGLVTQATAPNGSATRFDYDVFGNLVRRVDALGASWSYAYDRLGRLVAKTSPSGTITQYDLDGRGNCIAVRREGSVRTFQYDSMGAMVAASDEQGRTTRFVRRGMSKLCELVREDGAVARFRYDREGRLVHIENERGEVHTITLDVRGQTMEERHFDGRLVEYGYDLAGRLTKLVDGDRQAMQMTYDAAGRLARREYADGSADEMSYDSSGRVTSCSSATTQVSLVRNAVGWVTKETVTNDGRTFQVEVDLDLMGNVVRRRTSLGHDASYRRNVRGWAERLQAEGADLAFGYDVVGRPVQCLLPGGAAIETGWDANDRMVSRVVRRTSGAPLVGPGEPEWVGVDRPDVVLSQRYEYGAAGQLGSFWDSIHGTTRLEYDPRGQLLASLPERGRRVVLAYDPCGNPFDADSPTATRRYGDGNRLLERDGVFHVYDDCGRLVEKRTSSQPESWTARYTWSGGGMLAAVDSADGARVTFDYDPFARRTRKEVRRPQPGGGVEVTTHRYLWSGSTLVHATEEVAGQQREQRTFLFDELTGAPMAERVGRADDVMVGGAWRFFLVDDAGTPERVIDARGEVVADLRTNPGAYPATGTFFGHLGQVYDAETGLAYNRHRYYDPVARRYISPDPLGVMPDLNGYRYAENDPLNASDPLGLTMTSRIEGFGRGPITATSGAAPRRTDPAVTEAVNNAVNSRSDLPANRGCAEVSALHEMAAQIRDDARARGQGELSNEQVRTRMRDAFRNGATIDTRDEQGNQVNPCARCAQVFRELGLHPRNITRPGEDPTAGGVRGPPNPNRRKADQPPPFPGAWDGAHIHRKGAPSRNGANTAPSSTPPFTGS